MEFNLTSDPNDHKQYPKYGEPVLCILEHWYTQGKRYNVLYRVDEDDCIWRVFDDKCEVSHDWTVVAWCKLEDPDIELKKAEELYKCLYQKL